MRGKASQASPPAHVTQAVYGLDAGRAQARRSNRARQFRSRLLTLTMTAILLAGVAGAAWVGYQAYVDHSRKAEQEHQQGVQEWERKHAEQSMDDVIDDIEEDPVFNGPGAPRLGLAPGSTQPPIDDSDVRPQGLEP